MKATPAPDAPAGLLDAPHRNSRSRAPICPKAPARRRRVPRLGRLWAGIRAYGWYPFLAQSVFAHSVQAVNRFPRPDFQSGYESPATEAPASPGLAIEYIDVGLLFLALCAASWAVLRMRSRNAVFVIMALCLLYFGFIRKGCVCSIGAIQNVSAAVFQPDYLLSAPVLLFFLLPLVFALAFGRVFCAAVCPLGAIQDVFGRSPRHVPKALASVLSLLPILYLGLAILLAATGATFIICRFDPFVGFFRFSAPFGMLIFGALLLVGGIFIARPYCRFLCPYGVILGWLSSISRWHAKIYPHNCIQCHLCVETCPYDAISTPASPEQQPLESRAAGVRRLQRILIILPMAIILGGFAGYLAAPLLSQAHPVILLSAEIQELQAATEQPVSKAGLESAALPSPSEEAKAFLSSGQTIEQLNVRAQTIHFQFLWGGAITGAVFGFLITSRLFSLSLWPSLGNYEPDRYACLSCARCFRACPHEYDPNWKPGQANTTSENVRIPGT